MCFFLWHAVALAAYTIPEDTTDPVSGQIRRVMVPLVRPYMLITSQWQRWNLFSKNPLRRVTAYRIDVQRGDDWTPLTTLERDTIPWLRRSDELKILRRMEADGSSTDAIRRRYLALSCAEHNLQPGTSVRMVLLYAVIPTEAQPIRESDWQQHVKTKIACPSA